MTSRCPRHVPKKPCAVAATPFSRLALPPAQGVDEAKQLLQAVASGLEQALRAQAQSGEEARPGRGQAPDQQRVVSVLLVRARPFYGFAEGDGLFIRISLVDPRDVRTAAALLATGRVLNRVFVPHEAHVPYELQAMMDLHIAGMGLVRCARVCFRGPMPTAACAHRRAHPQPGDGGGVTFDRAAGAAANVPLPESMQPVRIPLLSHSPPLAFIHIPTPLHTPRSCGPPPPSCPRDGWTLSGRA
jgi:hypothetical protein